MNIPHYEAGGFGTPALLHNCMDRITPHSRSSHPIQDHQYNVCPPHTFPTGILRSLQSQVGAADGRQQILVDTIIRRDFIIVTWSSVILMMPRMSNPFTLHLWSIAFCEQTHCVAECLFNLLSICASLFWQWWAGQPYISAQSLHMCVMVNRAVRFRMIKNAGSEGIQYLNLLWKLIKKRKQ